jgi:hypothetical protein
MCCACLAPTSMFRAGTREFQIHGFFEIEISIFRDLSLRDLEMYVSNLGMYITYNGTWIKDSKAYKYSYT